MTDDDTLAFENEGLDSLVARGDDTAYGVRADGTAVLIQQSPLLGRAEPHHGHLGARVPEKLRALAVHRHLHFQLRVVFYHDRRLRLAGRILACLHTVLVHPRPYLAPFRINLRARLVACDHGCFAGGTWHLFGTPTFFYIQEEALYGDRTDG